MAVLDAPRPFHRPKGWQDLFKPGTGKEGAWMPINGTISFVCCSFQPLMTKQESFRQ